MNYSDLTVWTIGHSTRSLDEFLKMLSVNGIEVLVDIRRFPGSRKYPHFGQQALKESLQENGFEYKHLEALGGRRKPNPDSQNTVWRNESFRAYADYMQTPEFHNALNKLLKTANEKRTVMMCSEAVWWRCHRSLVADLLKARGAKVAHIMSATKTDVHPYTSAARLVNGRLTYNPDEGQCAKANVEVHAEAKEEIT